MLDKKVSTTYALFFLCLFGLAGFHKFYLGKIGIGILYLITFGFFGIGLLIDLFTIPDQVSKYNYDRLKAQKKLARMISEEMQKNRGH